MIVKGIFLMIKNDRKLATVHSWIKNGGIELWCCSCSFRNVYELRYVISFYTPDGLKDAVGLRSYDVNTQISALMNDVIELANTPLLERD